MSRKHPESESVKRYSITGTISLFGSDYDKFEKMLARVLPELSRVHGADVLMLDAKVKGGTIRYLFDRKSGDLRSVEVL